MEAEPGRRGVRALEAVDERAERVQDTAGHDQHHDGPAAAREHLRHVEHGHPAQGHVGRHVQPARRTGPEQAEGDADCGTGPADRQQGDPIPALEQGDGQRRVRARDDHEDVGVIEAPQHERMLGLPGAAVVGRADPEQQARGGHEHHAGQARAEILADGHEQQTGDHRGREGDEVDHPAQARLGQLRAQGPGATERGPVHARAHRLGGERVRGRVSAVATAPHRGGSAVEDRVARVVRGVVPGVRSVGRGAVAEAVSRHDATVTYGAVRRNGVRLPDAAGCCRGAAGAWARRTLGAAAMPPWC